MPNEKLTNFDLLFPSANSISSYLTHPVKDILLVAPSFGANQYDKLLVGAIFTNIKLPPSTFQYLLIPMYGTGSHKFNGLGKFNYSHTSISFKTDLFLNASMFSDDEVIEGNGSKKVIQFKKLVPGFRFTLKERNPLSSSYKYVQWKTFLIDEQHFQFVPDTVFNGTDTSYSYHFDVPWQKRYLNQLQLVIGNYRALYPFEFKLQEQQAQDFIRTTLTANYYFNYTATDGLQVRLFAGKFNYLGEQSLTKQFNNDRYFLNMTGPNGYEDYTYSDYFIGRNSFEGVTSQQIMIRDGGFKVRTDLLLSKIAKTDNWLTALNFNSSIPDKLNPLSVLPIKIPLHFFLDVGTYAEAWEETSGNNKFLYDFGIHIPLFRETINVYIPLLYSKVYRDYFKQYLDKNRFLKEISFSIDLYNKDLNKIARFTGF